MNEYPGYTWKLDANSATGMLDVYSPDLSGSHGFRIKGNGPVSWHDLRHQVILGAGELLERYNAPRTGKDDSYHDLDKDLKGLPVGDTA